MVFQGPTLSIKKLVGGLQKAAATGLLSACRVGLWPTKFRNVGPDCFAFYIWFILGIQPMVYILDRDFLLR